MFLGFDPSVHASAIAVVDSNEAMEPIVVGAWVCQSDDELQDRVSVVAQIHALNLFFLSTFPADWRNRIKAYTVESQEMVYTTKQGANVRDVALLGPVSGCALSMCKGLFPSALPSFPAPSEWKGNKPKHVDQLRTYSRLHVNCKKRGSHNRAYQEPLNLPSFVGMETIKSVTQWKDVGDAIGMALRCREKYILCERIVKARSSGDMSLAWDGK